MNVLQEYSPAECVSNFGNMINIIDNILLGGNKTQIVRLKSFFGFKAKASDVELANWVYFGYVSLLRSTSP